MSTSPQATGQRVIYVHLDHEPEVTQEVRLSILVRFFQEFLIWLLFKGFAIGTY